MDILTEAAWSDPDGVYLTVLRAVAAKLAGKAKSVLDVGSGGLPHLEWFAEVPDRVSLDRRTPYSAPGITSVTADFFTWKSPRRFTLVTCFETLDRVPRADLFAQMLLRHGRIVIISVPYAWSAERSGSRPHHDINEATLREWFGRDPSFSYVCHEVSRDAPRLIQIYEHGTEQWHTLAERRDLRKSQTSA